MKQIKIVYITKTKHSKKIAHALGQKLNINEENILVKPDLQGTDLLFIVSGIYGGKSLPELISFLNSLNNEQVKNVAFVTSCAGKQVNLETLKVILEKKNINIIGEIVVRGSFLFFYMSHPNKKDIKEVIDFGVSLSTIIG